MAPADMIRKKKCSDFNRIILLVMAHNGDVRMFVFSFFPFCLYQCASLIDCI